MICLHQDGVGHLGRRRKARWA